MFSYLHDTKLCIHIVVLYFSTLVIVLPLILQNVKHSLFYRPQTAEEGRLKLQQLNDFRLSQADQYFNRLQITNNPLHMTTDTKDVHDVIISVITVSRNKIQTKPPYQPKYLTQIIWKLLNLLTQLRHIQGNGSMKFGLFICNVDSNPDMYHEANYLAKFVHMVKRFKKIHFSMVHILEKEKEDYMFCLNQSMNIYSSRYHLVTEDDALPNDNMLKVLTYMIAKHLDFNYLRGEYNTPNKVAYVKFYHPERLLNYLQFSYERLLELLGLALICSSICFYVAKYFRPKSEPWVLWIVFTIYFVLVLIEIGRVNINHMREWFSPYLYSFSPAPSCCTPAVLFPNQTAKEIIEYLQKRHCNNGYAKDSILDDFVKKKKVPTATLR